MKYYSAADKEFVLVSKYPIAIDFTIENSEIEHGSPLRIVISAPKTTNKQKDSFINEIASSELPEPPIPIIKKQQSKSGRFLNDEDLALLKDLEGELPVTRS